MIRNIDFDIVRGWVWFLKPEAPQLGWSESVAASKRGNFRVWGLRSRPAEPRMFERSEFARRP